MNNLLNFTSTSNTLNLTDRFIPFRQNLISQTNCTNEPNPKYQDQLFDILKPQDKNLFKFRKNKENNKESMRYFKPKRKTVMNKKRKLERKPIRVLDAPGLLDDYYLNLVSWSQTNLIGVGLEDSVYFYNFLNNEIVKHLELPKIFSDGSIPSDNEFCAYVCSLSFNSDGKFMATGDSNGKLLLSDITKNKIIVNSTVHSSRISSLHWQDNMLISGSRDRLIRLYDVRSKICQPVFTFTGHLQEICGLKFSPNCNYIASGGNDNQLLLWDMRKSQLVASLGDHQAAVKALTWNPKNQNVLVSGAGTADKHLRLFDVAKFEELAVVDTGSQVCNVTFDKEGETLLSTHGYSLNQLILWEPDKEFRSLKKEDMLIAHKLRVLYLARSPCGKYVVTGAGDETLRIWDIFEDKASEQKSKSVLNRDLFRLR